MIFTIGTSNRSLPEFTFELQRRRITHLVDVRSNPYSRHVWFNAPRIEMWSERCGIMYRQEGEVLGGRSDVQIKSARYRRALEGLRDSAVSEHVAIFCSEGAPEQCHRCYQVGAALLGEFGLAAINILRNGEDEDIRETLKRVSSKLLPSGAVTPQPDFFWDKRDG